MRFMAQFSVVASAINIVTASIIEIAGVGGILNKVALGLACANFIQEAVSMLVSCRKESAEFKYKQIDTIFNILMQSIACVTQFPRLVDLVVASTTESVTSDDLKLLALIGSIGSACMSGLIMCLDLKSLHDARPLTAPLNAHEMQSAQNSV